MAWPLLSWPVFKVAFQPLTEQSRIFLAIFFFFGGFGTLTLGLQLLQLSMTLDVDGDLSLLELSILAEGDSNTLRINEVGVLVARRATVQPDLLLVATLQVLDGQVELDSQLLLAEEAAVLVHVILHDILED